MIKIDVDTSREIRQWFKMGISGLSTLMVFDYFANDGKWMKTIADSLNKRTADTKIKLGELKDKITKH